LHLKSLHQTIGRMGQGTQAWRQPVHALPVQGIDHGLCATGPLRQCTAGLDVDQVAGSVLLFGRHAVRLAVVHVSGHRVHCLVQAAAQSHIDLLKTATDAQQGHSLLDASAHQGQGQRIALRVQRQAGIAYRLVKVRGVHIGRRARQHDPIHQRQQLRHLGRIGQREHDRLSLGTHLHGTGVFVTQQQKRHLVTVVTQ